MKQEVNQKLIKINKDVTLTLYPIGDHSKIFEIDPTEAEEFGEAPIQILEAKRYEYELSNKEYQLEATKECIPSKNTNSSRGIIAPGNYVGTLELNILSKNECLKTHVEVLATKFDASGDYDKSYRQNYRSMVEDITDKCTELLMQSNSPVNQYFEPNFEKENETLYQKFCFVKSVINRSDFEEAMLRIFSSPKISWKSKEEKVDIRSIKRFTNKNIQEILRGSNRIALPREHHLSQITKLESIPSKINNYKQEPSLDNPENRFIKHALQVYLQFCEDCSSVFKKDSKDQKEVDFIANKIESFLNHSFFKEISRPATLKLNSPTLQRKGGYRQILKSWLMFKLASQLTWTGGNDVYEAGKRDIASLYEYWLFFVLYDLFKNKFHLTKLTHKESSYSHLFEKTENGINLIIKSGQHTALEGETVIKSRALNVKFSFNRTFSGNKDSYPKSGSWTTSLRPDYTLSVWPKELSQNKAEIEEQIVHIHFDAKYKVHHFTVKNNFDGEDDETEKLNVQKEEERAGIFKNADLLKMHAYKDAIRRTGGAYILYPGNNESRFKGFHEVIPGLGAFSLNPDNEKADVLALSNFIDEVVYHLVNRASQRENIATKTYEITKDGEADALHEPIPEYSHDGKKIIPSETFVLIGFFKSEKHFEWIKRKGLYNFRMGTRQGSLILDKETVSSKYLLLHTTDHNTSGDLWKIVSKGPRVLSKLDLIKKGYPSPSHDNHDNYLVFEIEPVLDPEFKNASWDFRKLKNYSTSRASAKPFTASLAELMKHKIK